MTDNVVPLPIIPRPGDREASKAAVQEMTHKFSVDTWRGDKFADARMFIDRLVNHPLGGKQWVLRALEDLRQYVEKR